MSGLFLSGEYVGVGDRYTMGKRRDGGTFIFTNRRRALQVADSQKLFIAVVWVLKYERRIFNLFPEVVMKDRAQQANKERRPLCALIGRGTD
eukprot:13343093-Ditylum_brightwellii.AAC.1